MICPNCQSPNADNVRFCTNCGASLLDQSPPLESWRIADDDDQDRTRVRLDTPEKDKPFADSSFNESPFDERTSTPPVYQSPTYQTPTYQPPTYTPPGNFELPSDFAPPANNASSVTMAAYYLAIISVCIMGVGLIPCLGWLNWFSLPLGLLALILGIIAIKQANLPATQKKATIALVLSLITLVIGSFRFTMGGGCI